nr:hypothetical protein [Pseudomonas sp.]
MSTFETTAVASGSRPALSEGGSWMLAFLLGLAALWLALGNPISVINGEFVFDSDYPNAAAAFEVFVRDSWRYPLGDNPRFGGVNLFFSDGAPWFAMLAKLIYGVTGVFVPFDTLIVLNFVLFSMMAYRWSCRLCPDTQERWLITLLLVFSLIMPVRTLGAQHIALSGYWVLLWGMCCVTPLRHAPSVWQRWECVAVATVAFMTHSYLGAMTTGFMLVVLILQRRWLQSVVMLAAPLLALYLFGFFGSKYAMIPGAKEFSLDLLAFVQSLNWGILPSLYPVAPPQGDVVLYLGTGVWALLLMCVAAYGFLMLRRRYGHAPAVGQTASAPPWPHVFLYLSAISLALFALAFNLRVAGQVWVSLPLVEPFSLLYDRFRSPGRFAAPLAYLTMVTVALLWLRLRSRVAPAVWWAGILVAVGLQVADLQFASEKIPPASPVMRDAEQQRQQLASLLAGESWSGRVFKDVGYYELEEQRLLDRLLVQHGANAFSVAHGARLDPDEVRERSLLVQTARPGDVIITRQEARVACAGDQVEIKTFSVCLLQ